MKQLTLSNAVLWPSEFTGRKANSDQVFRSTGLVEKLNSHLFSSYKVV